MFAHVPQTHGPDDPTANNAMGETGEHVPYLGDGLPIHARLVVVKLKGRDVDDSLGNGKFTENPSLNSNVSLTLDLHSLPGLQSFETLPGCIVEVPETVSTRSKSPTNAHFTAFSPICISDTTRPSRSEPARLKDSRSW